MFQGTLLESSVQAPRKRWPMATAFLLETTVVATLVIVPLLVTKVVPVFAHSGYYCPTAPIPLANKKPPRPSGPNEGSGSASSRTAVVSLSSCSGPNCIHIGTSVDAKDTDEPPNLNPASYDRNGPDLSRGTGHSRPSGPGEGRIRLSTLSEALLIKRVDPIYPHMAQLAGVSGLVKLHAIIAKDGSIQSLGVISGHPLLAPAAVEAVRQWQYRPYRLNDEIVEVETFITVNFKRER